MIINVIRFRRLLKVKGVNVAVEIIKIIQEFLLLLVVWIVSKHHKLLISLFLKQV